MRLYLTVVLVIGVVATSLHLARERNARLWSVLEAWGTAIGAHFGSN